MPQSSPTVSGSLTSPGWTSVVVWVMSLSPITDSVTLPALRAVTATVMASPGLYSGLSSAISSRSGVSAEDSAYQPESKPMVVSGPAGSALPISSR